MEVIIDTNFILSCLDAKIDFLEAEKYGQILLPSGVLDELEKLTKSKERKVREISSLALQIINKNRSNFKIIQLEKKFVDRGIFLYVQKNQDLIVASLDKELKEHVKNKCKILTISGRKKLILI